MVQRADAQLHHNTGYENFEGSDNPQPWNYQFLVNGTLDELLYDRGRFVTDGLAFKDLKSRAHINAAAKGADNSPDFSAIIRANRPGFEDQK